MNKIIQFFLIACLIVYSKNSIAQSAITVEGTQQYNSFRFTGSSENDLSDEYTGILTGAYTAGFRWTADFGLIARSGLGIRNAGAEMVYDNMNYSWKLQYINSSIGAGYIHNLGRINPYIVASGYFGYLMNGTQILNNEHFNITQSGLLSNTDYGIIFSPGVEFDLADRFSSFLEFKYLYGLKNIETDANQMSFNSGFSLSLGISFAL
jgi:hypothetical protein